MKLYHELKPKKIPLLFVIFLLFFFVIDSTFINSYAAPGGKTIFAPKIKIGKDSLTSGSSLGKIGKDSLTPGSFPGHYPSSKITKYSNLEIKSAIEKKLEKIKLNKPTTYQEQKINSLYNANQENFQSIVNYVRAFANFIIVIPQMLNYR